MINNNGNNGYETCVLIWTRFGRLACYGVDVDVDVDVEIDVDIDIEIEVDGGTPTLGGLIMGTGDGLIIGRPLATWSSTIESELVV